MTTSGLIPAERIERTIRVFRGRKVLLDSDLADLYDVETRILIQTVTRHAARLPRDFMFQLTPEEFARLKSQSVISKVGRGGRRTPPYAFTEQRVAM